MTALLLGRVKAAGASLSVRNGRLKFSSTKDARCSGARRA